MKVLLDECVDRRLAPLLLGHDVRTVAPMGWAGAENGRLVQLARGAFDAVVTLDRRFPYEQRGPGSGLAFFLLRAKSNRIADLEPLVPELLEALSQCGPEEVRVVGWMS